jgi:hypothetical protein
VVNFGPHFMTETSTNGRESLASTTVVNLMVGLMLLRWWRNCYKLAGPCGQTTKVSSLYLSHLVGLWFAVSSAISSNCSINMLLTTGDSEFPTAMPSFCCTTYPKTGSMWLLNRCPVIPPSSTCKGKHSGILYFGLLGFWTLSVFWYSWTI